MAKIALTLGLAAAGFLVGFFTFGIGAAFIGANVGLALGGVLGGLIFPTKLPNQIGPRLNDLTVSTSTNGAPIPIGYGTFRYSGNIIWSPGLKEHSKTTKHSAKGGPSYKSTDYTYTCSFATAWGEGEGAIQKIWFDSKIGYDITGDGVTNTAKYPAPTFYTGTQTQLPDPLIQADKGVNATSGYRGIIYAVWEDLLLTDFGNRIPNQQGLVKFKIGTL